MSLPLACTCWFCVETLRPPDSQAGRLGEDSKIGSSQSVGVTSKSSLVENGRYCTFKISLGWMPPKPKELRWTLNQRKVDMICALGKWQKLEHAQIQKLIKSIIKLVFLIHSNVASWIEPKMVRSLLAPGIIPRFHMSSILGEVSVWLWW